MRYVNSVVGGKSMVIFVKLYHFILYKIRTKEIQQKVNTISYVEKRSDFRYDFKLIGGKYISIGDDFYLGDNCRIEAWDSYANNKYTQQIIIGDNVRINSNIHVGSINKIKIGNDVLIGANVFITDHSHGKTDGSEHHMPPTRRPLYSKGEVVIEDGCWICENVIILPNVHVGKGSIIAAGSVVTKDVLPYTIVAGNPAKEIRVIEEMVV